MQEQAKEKRDDGQYNGGHDKLSWQKDQINNFKSEIKDLSEEYTRY